jgi:hypothetical protein
LKEPSEREGTALGQADVRKVQSHPPERAGVCDLLESPSQAAAGVSKLMRTVIDRYRCGRTREEKH